MPIAHSYVYSICGWVAHFLSNKEFLSFPMCESQIERNQQPQFIQWVYKSFFLLSFRFFFRFSSRMSFVWCINYSVKMAFKMDQWRMKYTRQATSQVSIPKIVQVLWSQIINRERKGYEMIWERKTWGRSVFDSESIFFVVVCIKNHFDLSLQPPSFWLLPFL